MVYYKINRKQFILIDFAHLFKNEYTNALDFIKNKLK